MKYEITPVESELKEAILVFKDKKSFFRETSLGLQPRLYQLDSKIGGVVHTHSNYATAFGTAGIPIPCVLTAIAEEFGGEIPCAPYAQSDSIAESVIKARGKGPVVLLGQHGVVAFHETPLKALKAAVMVEDVAKTVWIAKQLGPLKSIPPEDIHDWHGRYKKSYGQK
jgi:L-ribulose-5-phosphate 4-epimerase